MGGRRVVGESDGIFGAGGLLGGVVTGRLVRLVGTGMVAVRGRDAADEEVDQSRRLWHWRMATHE